MKMSITDWEQDAVLRKTAIRADGKTLGLIVQRMNKLEWVAVALETDVNNGPATLDSVFGNHSHKIIGDKYEGLAQALRAAEAFLDTWLSSSGVGIEKCGCEEIKP
jgi:hypothetical protein